MSHRLYIITNSSGSRVGSIRAITASSALRGFQGKFAGMVDPRGLRARKAAADERP